MELTAIVARPLNRLYASAQTLPEVASNLPSAKKAQVRNHEHHYSARDSQVGRSNETPPQRHGKSIERIRKSLTTASNNSQ